MSFQISKSTQFTIKELTIVTKAGNIDITEIYDELNIFDTLFLPVMNGTILIKDSIGLSGKLLFDGSEGLLIHIKKDKNSDIDSFKKSFRIYKQSNRENQTLNSEMYILHFVSDELMYYDQQRVNQSYEKTYSDTVKNILENYLKVPKNRLQGIYSPSQGIRKFVIPNLRPLEAIQWCAKRALDDKNSPNFVFYENNTGYNFASLSKLLPEQAILDIKFEPKNMEGDTAISEMGSARQLEVVSQQDSIEKTRSGVNAGKFIGFDPMTRTIATENISYGDHYSTMKHGNKTPNVSVIPNRDNKNNIEQYDSKKVVSVFGLARKDSKYIKKYDPTSISKEESPEKFVFQRNAILKNLMQKRIKLVMPGNFQLSSGFNVNVMAPNFGKKIKGSSNEDSSVSGKYIIIATRHIIGYDKHETIIEVATTSSDNSFIPAGSSKETTDILNY